MYVVYLAGGIASGKSLVARRLEGLGAWRIDLDQVSREVLAPGEPCLAEIARAFGDDLVDPDTGALDRAALAARAFADEESTALLESIEHPYIAARLEALLTGTAAECPDPLPAVCVVEIPLLDRVERLIPLADEVVAIVAPLETRLGRAVGRGMARADAERRALSQPSDDYLRAHADLVLDNGGTEAELVSAVDAWWDEHEAAGWAVEKDA